MPSLNLLSDADIQAPKSFNLLSDAVITPPKTIGLLSDALILPPGAFALTSDALVALLEPATYEILLTSDAVIALPSSQRSPPLKPPPEPACRTCIPTPDCVADTDLLDFYSLDGPIFGFQFNCPAGFTCDNNTFSLLCCDRILAVTIPPTATIEQRNSIINSIVRECVRLMTACGGGGGNPTIIPPPPGIPRPPGTPPPPPVIQFYFNAPQQCSVSCPDGGKFTYTVMAGKFAAQSQAQANQMAKSLACREASLNKLCISVKGKTTGCKDQFMSFDLIASGPLTQSPTGSTWSISGPAIDVNVLTYDSGLVFGSNKMTIYGTPSIAIADSYVTARIADNNRGAYMERTIPVVISDCGSMAQCVNTTCPVLNQSNFTCWNVVAGRVDLIGHGCNATVYDVLPGNGCYVDMDGSPGPGTLQSIAAVTLEAGKSYSIKVKVAGNNREAGTNQIGIAVIGAFSTSLSLDAFEPFAWHTFNFTAAANMTTKIQIGSLDAGYFDKGILLKSVQLLNDTDSLTLFDATFNNP